MKMYVEAFGRFVYFSHICIIAPKNGCGHATCIDALVPPYKIALRHASSIVVEWKWSLDIPTEMG